MEGSMSERLEQEMHARGAAYVILALDLATFVTPSSRETLLHLRGTREFHDYLEQLDLNDPRFIRDSDYRDVEQRGYELGVFNRILAEHNFAPTYRLNKQAVQFPPHLLNNVQFKDKFLKVWNRWDFWFRLSSSGGISLVLKLDIPRSRELVYLSRDVMGLQGHFDMDSARRKLAELQASPPNREDQQRILSIQQFMKWSRHHSMTDIEREYPPVVWQMAVEVVHQFIDACDGHLHSTAGPFPFNIRLTEKPDHSNGAGSLREQYTIFHFEEIDHYRWDEKRRHILLPHEVVTAPFSHPICGLLEGIMLQGKRAYFYPTHDARFVENLVHQDASGWEHEICILTDRSAVIYAYIPKQSHRVVFPSRHVPYVDYWKSILRGIEFGVETRLLVQLVEQMTSSYLAEALPLLRTQHRLGRIHLRRFDTLAANAARIIAHLRTITAPHLIAQASYAVSKFDLFMQETGVLDILAHAEKNLADLSSLLERSHDLWLQDESQGVNEFGSALSVIFAGLALCLGILALPSYIADWEGQKGGYLAQQSYYGYLPHLGEVLVLLLTVMGAIAFAVALINLIRVRRRRHPRRR